MQTAKKTFFVIVVKFAWRCVLFTTRTCIRTWRCVLFTTRTCIRTCINCLSGTIIVFPKVATCLRLTLLMLQEKLSATHCDMEQWIGDCYQHEVDRCVHVYLL